MAVAPSLIPGLEEIVRNGDPKRRAEAARRIAELFLAGAANFRPDHVDLFDGILVDLVPHAEMAARADLAERLSLLANAPRRLVGQLAREDEIAIAGPLLRRSPVIDEAALIEIARAKGQGHLLAMSERPTLSPDLTDVIVRRGDRDVVRRAAGNAGAQFSQAGYSALIKRASHDGVLTLAVGQRDDLSDAAAEGASGRIDRHRPPPPARRGQARAAIGDQPAMSEISGVHEAVESRRNFAPAQRAILALHRCRRIERSRAAGFCQELQIRGIGRRSCRRCRRSRSRRSTA